MGYNLVMAWTRTRLLMTSSMQCGWHILQPHFVSTYPRNDVKDIDEILPNGFKLTNKIYRKMYYF